MAFGTFTVERLQFRIHPSCDSKHSVPHSFFLLCGFERACHVVQEEGHAPLVELTAKRQALEQQVAELQVTVPSQFLPSSTALCSVAAPCSSHLTRGKHTSDPSA